MTDLSNILKDQAAIRADMDQLTMCVRALLRDEGHEFQDRVALVIDCMSGAESMMPQAVGGLASIGLAHLLETANPFVE